MGLPLSSASTTLLPFPTIPQSPGASWTALLIVESLACLWGVSLQEGPRWLWLLFPCIPPELCNASPHSWPPMLPPAFPCMCLLTAAGTLWHVHRAVNCVVGDILTPQPLLLGPSWLEGCSSGELRVVPSLCRASVSALQLNTADVLPLLGEMRLGG